MFPVLHGEKLRLNGDVLQKIVNKFKAFLILTVPDSLAIHS